MTFEKRLNRGNAALACSDPNHFVERADKNFSVADHARARAFENRFDDWIDECLRESRW